MKIAVIALTRSGAVLAQTLKQTLSADVDIFIKEGRGIDRQEYEAFEILKDLVAKIFTNYDGLVFIMATGITVRVIAPHVVDKRNDPAVVVMDDKGLHAISLLSGHIGGANALARQTAAAVGAQPVITTATDVNNLPAVDLLALESELTIEPFSKLKTANAAIVNGEQTAVFIDKSLVRSTEYEQMCRMQGFMVYDLEKITEKAECDFAIVVTDKQLQVAKPHIFLRPPTMAVGVGCRRGTDGKLIAQYIEDACAKIGRSSGAIAAIGSVDLKADEGGLLWAAQYLKIKTVFFTNEELQACIGKFDLTISDFVEAKVGVGNICEAAALLAGRAEKLLLRKTVYPNVTVAIAGAKLP